MILIIFGCVLQLYGRRAPWEDPADWVIESYPWPHPNDTDWPSLLRLRPEDVGYDMQTTNTSGTKSAQAPQSDAEGDPLVCILSLTAIQLGVNFYILCITSSEMAFIRGGILKSLTHLSLATKISSKRKMECDRSLPLVNTI